MPQEPAHRVYEPDTSRMESDALLLCSHKQIAVPDSEAVSKERDLEQQNTAFNK